MGKKEVWFLCGSQHLYGEETLIQVKEHAEIISQSLHDSEHISVRIIFKQLLTRPEEIYRSILEANAHQDCIGIIAWMHTFSPAKMWIKGLRALQKPLLHLHTQFNQEIPWSEIDMDFMNLNQSAHGGREFGFICSRMGIKRKVLSGHWNNVHLHKKLDKWCRVAAAWEDSQNLKIARLGDNMREVAVTEGNKVSAQIQFGYAVNGYGMGDLKAYVDDVSDQDIEIQVEEYEASYSLATSLKHAGEKRHSLLEAARIELGLKSFLEAGGFHAFTNTFENLHGLTQLPGLAVQRLMAEGYGFGAEGDWKTAALVRAMKVMGNGLDGGNSFMEDYTYHFHQDNDLVLGAHMLEICPSIASEKPSCEIHPLGIGGKADPVRLVFNAKAGNSLNASMIDLGHRFRLLVNEVEAVEMSEEMPKLPVARALWNPLPNLETAANAWILAGGAHHTCYSESLDAEYLLDFAEMAGIESLLINQNSNLADIKKELRWNAESFNS
ncbi:MAG: L-arabinose isomerase [Bacteroidota bacterium]